MRSLKINNRIISKGNSLSSDSLINGGSSTGAFTIGVIDELETLAGSILDQGVTYTIQQVLQFTAINLNAGDGSDTSVFEVVSCIQQYRVLMI